MINFRHPSKKLKRHKTGRRVSGEIGRKNGNVKSRDKNREKRNRWQCNLGIIKIKISPSEMLMIRIRWKFSDSKNWRGSCWPNKMYTRLDWPFQNKIFSRCTSMYRNNFTTSSSKTSECELFMLFLATKLNVFH